MTTIFARLPWLHKLLIVMITAITVVATLLLPDPETLIQTPNQLKVGQHYPVALDYDLLAQEEQLPPMVVLQWKKQTVQPGESSALLFKKVGLSARSLYQLTSSNEDIHYQLTHLRPGDQLYFGLNDDNDIVQLRRQLNSYETFVINKTSSGYESHIEAKEVYFQYNYAQATIHSNFWNAASQAGLTPNQIMQLAGIFGWDIDFALDIRSGDHFQLLYQEKVVEGEVMERGDIIAATFTNQGKTFTAIRDDESGNYYDENGRAMKKAFLRSPVDFRRVSSNFNPRRLHPVTGRVRPHRGTDYVAPVGTPIWAAGDGIVQKAGYNQFNGNYVFIRHSNTYVTKYLHLSRRMVKTGQRVKQGQTIGTLGGTGRVTGPHLHYEFLVHGIHKNPRTVDLPLSKSLTGKTRDTFIANAKLRLAKLSRYSELLFATSPSQ
ncbi:MULTISPECIES: peptidoglycan DD-metalloendopeptidase family protein [Vibrio]|uniref:Peptidoglycan DD-metalloendopeptidase family protein n=2 Tax=Vibrio TaxID=662 RepID=A0A7X4LJ27_9VIBR|nr:MULTISPECIES: peptidoglycan DD-metalloendopeptidase family protein [Vibrio]MBF8999252.1 peptidoglycan DD-metalloendopeptidase family protein [Vibrio nitrifigilis]MZI92577.1 peptidoglycan DD-metalloendopeptidase family protein [Vibrio eleionomae]